VRTSDGGLSLQTAGLLPAGRPAAVRGARWTIEQLARAVQDPTVVRVTPSVRCIPSLDLSLPDVDAPHVHDGPPPNWRGLTGKNVLVGIVDTGIDLHHSDFLRTDGKTRVLALWDQTATGSSDPPRGFDYGKEWTAEQIDAGIVNSFDEVGHGTHVAGIAAGNGAATGNGQAPYRYVGMAPEATIAVVKTDFWDQSIADGVAYVFQKADSLGIPAVVNLSLGTQFGPHDGSDDFSYNLLLAGVGGAGHLLVAAAGNENGDGIHASRSLEPGATSAMTFHIPPYTPQNGNSNDEVDLDGWYDASAGLSLEMVSPGGHHVGPVARGDETAVDTPDGRVEISNGVFDPSNGDENFSIRIVDQIVNMPPREGTWQIRLQSSDPDTVRIDVWNWYYSMSGPVRFVDGLDESMTVGSPATADSAIGVGAYTTKASWVDVDGITRLYDPPPQIGEIAYFSSIGPRRDGVVKPEVAAPGRGVASALSEVARYANPSITNSAITEDGVHVVFQGTSMASPHVAGLCALMMQTFGPLTIRDALARLTASARSDPFTGIVPNPTWGWGKIDAFQATAYYTPVVVIEAAAAQNGDRVEVRFLLTEDVAAGALEVWREDPGAPRHPVGMSGSEGERRFVDSTLVEEGTYRYLSLIHISEPTRQR
ncbi:MAG: S8 family serine peptidase, partial [Candidatus Eisenbacteria bacterium]|nr:S8 family serine peptidase [Candidatus Eisenbacteria bacterium]